MSRVHSIGAVGFAFSGLAFGACAASGPDAPVAGEPLPVEAGLTPGVLARLAPPQEVEVVRIEITGDERSEPEIRITCELERKPGTRIVVGQACERVGNASGIVFHPDDWDIKIKSPGVYEMRQRH